MRRHQACVSLVLLLGACGAEPTTPSPALSDDETRPKGRRPVPLLAKAAAPVTTEWTVDDLGGVASDGRGPYTDGTCGVAAVVFTTGGGNGQLRPSENRSRCGYVRTISVTVGSLVLNPEGLVVHGIWGTPPGTTTGADLTINTGHGSCALVRFNAESGGQVTVTAGINGFGLRTWLVETTGSHFARCYAFQSGQFVWDGLQRTVPLRLTVAAR